MQTLSAFLIFKRIFPSVPSSSTEIVPQMLPVMWELLILLIPNRVREHQEFVSCQEIISPLAENRYTPVST